MKRHQALIPLAHDHHHALAQVRRLSLAAKANEQARLRQGREFLSFFDSDTTAHFTEEEDVVLPLVANVASLGEHVERTLREHSTIRSLVESLRAELKSGVPLVHTMEELASAMRAHIRFEEKVLFPVIEELVPDQLSSVVLAMRVREKVKS